MRGFLSNSYRGIFKVCIVWHHVESQPALHQNQTRPMLLHWEQVQPSLLQTKPACRAKAAPSHSPTPRGALPASPPAQLSQKHCTDSTPNSATGWRNTEPRQTQPSQPAPSICTRGGASNPSLHVQMQGTRAGHKQGVSARTKPSPGTESPQRRPPPKAHVPAHCALTELSLFPHPTETPP